MSDDEAHIVTVDGRIDPEDFGFTLAHEHTFIDISGEWLEEPETAIERRLFEEPVTLETLWHIRRYPYKNRSNARLDSYSTAVDEVTRYLRAGGDSIVDMTPKNVGGDPERVRAVARETGVQYVHGTAYYTKATHPDRIEDASIDEIAAEFVSDVRTGIGDTDVRAGLIGELGVSGRIHDREEAVLRAGARASLETGAPVSVHPPGRLESEHQGFTHPSSRWGLAILDILEDEGLPLDRVVVSHMDRTWAEFDEERFEYQLEIAERGAYVEYDLWGMELYQDSLHIGWPSDRQRVDAVRRMVDAGYSSQLLCSQDICTKLQLTKYGGFGYEHLPRNVVPMLERWEVPESVIEKLFVENPARVYTFDDAE